MKKACHHRDCPLRGLARPLTDFSKQPGKPQGVNPNCKVCCNRTKSRRFRTPEGRRQAFLEAARKRARSLGVPCDLRVEDIVIPKRCPALGILLSHGDKAVHDSSPSLDRIVPSLGYVQGNVVVVSHLANRIKNSATPSELTKVARFYSRAHLLLAK